MVILRLVNGFEFEVKSPELCDGLDKKVEVRKLPEMGNLTEVESCFGGGKRKRVGGSCPTHPSLGLTFHTH